MKLQKDKSQTISFDIEVEGTSEKVNPRLILKDKNISVIYEGKMNGKDATFEINKLSELFKDNKIDAAVEVIVEGRYFKPWESQIELEEPISVKVNESIKEPQVKTPEIKVKEPSIIQPEIKKIVETVKPKSKKKIEANKFLKIKSGGILKEVFVNSVTDKQNYFMLEVIDEAGNEKTIKIKK